MNREIKFRGKCLEDGEWVFGDLRVVGKARMISILIPQPKPVTEVTWMVDPKTVGQYTGLKDKNGEKIFEGDVVKGHYYINGNKKRIVGFVRFVRAGWYIEGVKQYEYVTTRLTPAFERIGNIHDNPELLEVLGDE